MGTALFQEILNHIQVALVRGHLEIAAMQLVEAEVRVDIRAGGNESPGTFQRPVPIAA